MWLLLLVTGFMALLTILYAGASWAMGPDRDLGCEPWDPRA